MKEKLTLPPEHDGKLWYCIPKGYVHRMHHHEELELNLVTRGTARYLVEERAYDLRRGSQIWLFPEQEHILLDSSTQFEMWILVFRSKLVQRCSVTEATRVLREGRPVGEFCKVLPEAATVRLAGLFKEVSDSQEEAPRFNAGVAYALLTAWKAQRSETPVTTGSDIHPAVEKAARLLHDESDPINLEELGRRSGLSASRLSRLFKEQTGISLVRYRNKRRIERFFERYGLGRRKSMLVAALESGFGSYPQFHRVFKEIVGCGPAEYRRRKLDP